MSPTVKDLVIRALLVAAGITLLFFTPAFLEGHLLAKFGGFMATLAGVLGPDRMGHLNTAVLLTIVYIVGIGPMRIVTWIRRDDPLAAPEGPSSWRKKPEPNPGLDRRQRARFQF
jgi:hypothetical protein